MFMSIRDRCRLWFFSAAEDDMLYEDVSNKYAEIDLPDLQLRGGEGENTSMSDPDHDVIREEVRANRKTLNETRVWVSRIDERTAFIARIVFALFVSFIAAVGAGLVLALFI